MEKTKILLVEDDINLGTLLKEYFNAKGYDIEMQTDGEKGLKAFKREDFDLCILDIMLPVKDGFSLARDIRILDNETPIIFLTAKGLNDDVLKGFSIGADDYITKPFSMEELLFRVEAIMRRIKKNVRDQEIYTIGKFTFNVINRILSIDENKIKLTTKESDLLRLLCENQNRVLDRDYALKSVWRDNNYFNARSMDVYITKLRKHLKTDTSIQIINIHGKGYKLIL
ncbi:response regulator transcription factor [Bacteroidota bacterium]